MSWLSDASHFLDALSRLSRQQRLLRASTMLAPAVALGVEVRAGAALHAWVVVLLGGFTLLSVLLPDSHAPLAVTLLVGGYWAMQVGQELSVSLLVVTLALLVFHVSCLLGSYGPPSVVLDAPMLRMWWGRSSVAFAVAVLVWLAGRVATVLDLPGSGWVLAAALLVVVGWTALLSRRLSVGSG